MKRTILLAAATLLALNASPAFCKTIKKRAAGEERRIEKGTESGKLTPKETQRLENEQQQIDQERKDAMEDGKMTERERKDIRHDQKRLGKDIQHKKHNARHTQPQAK